MARGGTKAVKRKIKPDPVYNNILVTKFINRIMLSGKKTAAQQVLYKTFDILKEQNHDPLLVFQNAIDNVGPKVEVKARRIGGAAYQVPTEVRGERKVSLAVRWIVEAARKRSSSEHKSFASKLAAELLDASNNLGDAIKKRDVAYRMAEANKAFAHFRW